MPTKRLFSTGRALLRGHTLSVGSGSSPGGGGGGSTGDSSQWWMTVWQTNHFFGPPANPQYATVTDGGARNAGSGGSTLDAFSIPIAAAGTVQELQIKLSSAPGAGKSWTFAIGSVSVTISGTATTGTATGTQHYNAGDPIIVTVTNSGDPSITVVHARTKFLPDTADQFCYGGTFLGSSLGSPNGPPYYTGLLHGRAGNTFDAGPGASNTSIAPIAGTVRSLYVRAASAPGGGGSWVFTIYKNGTSTGITATMSGSSQTASATGLSLAVAAGDYLALKADKTSSPSDINWVSYGTCFEPAVAGQFLWCNSGGNDTLGTDYSRIMGNACINSGTLTAISATESDVQMAAPADLSWGAMAIVIQTARGGPITWTTRLNGADGGITVTVPTGSTAAVVGTGLDAIVAGDLLDIKRVPGSGAFETGAHAWSTALIGVLGEELDSYLKGYWKADEASGNALDAHSVGPYDLTETNGPGTTTGIINGARNLVRASNQWFINVSSALIANSTDDWSFQAWVNPSGTSGYYPILGPGATGNQKQYILLEDSTGYLCRWSDYNTGVAITPGVLTHIIYTFHSTGTNTGIETFYINGVRQTPRVGSVPAPSTWFVIGTDGAGGGHYFNGAIDEIGLWIGRCLLPPAVARLYNSGAGLAYSSF